MRDDGFKGTPHPLSLPSQFKILVNKPKDIASYFITSRRIGEL